MKTFLIIATALLLISLFGTGCGPASKLRRAERLISKAELQGAAWNSDTVWVQRNVFRPETRVDSVTVIKPGDSVVIFKDRLEVRIKRLAGDTIFVDAKCKADTVRIKVPVNVYRTITAKGWLRWWHLVIALVVGVVFGRIFLKMIP